MEETESVFDDFDVEMSDVEVKLVNKFDRLQRASEGGSVTTAVIEYKGRIYVGSANHNVYCLNPDNGKLTWKYKTDGIIMESEPVIVDDVLYISSFDHNLYALDAIKGTLIWKFKTGEKITATPAYSDGLVYTGSCDQNFYAVDAKTGKLVWNFHTFGWTNTNPLIVGDKIYIGSYDRFIYCLDKKTGDLIWKFETQGEIFNTTKFAYKNGIIYCPSMDGNLRAINAETGKLIWKIKLANYGLASSALVHGDMLLQPTRDGALIALTMDGKVIWKFKGNEEDVMGVPIVHDERIYVGSYGDWCVFCLDMSGKELWRFKTSHGNYERPTVIGKNVIVASWDCNIYCLDTETQKLVWKFKAEGSPVELPPPHEAFEIETTIPQSEFNEEKKKSYDLKLDEDEGDINFYKSRITYQVSTQYTAKGKYQIDSREEEF